MEKIKSYIGFAIKANKCLFGQSQCKYSNKNINLLIISNDASENLLKLAEKIRTKQNCDLIKLNTSLSGIIHKNDIKIIAILDENLSRAILNEIKNIGE